MGPEFIFSRDIEDLVREGRKTLEAGEGARISAAAWDLIREQGIEVVYQVRPETPPRAEPPATESKSAPETAKEEAGPAAEKAAPEEGVALPSSTPPAAAEEELERIVDRVVERFKELKGRGTSPKPEQTASSGTDDDLILCRCEEITRGEIKKAIRNGMQTVSGVKRITRAGMGLCQGQTCERLVTQILAQELGRAPAELEPMTARAPVRPLPLAVLATG
jgi:bacterioferritin-associated ferredoxin